MLPEQGKAKKGNCVLVRSTLVAMEPHQRKVHATDVSNASRTMLYNIQDIGVGQ